MEEKEKIDLLGDGQLFLQPSKQLRRVQFREFLANVEEDLEQGHRKRDRGPLAGRGGRRGGEVGEGRVDDRVHEARFVQRQLTSMSVA
jgi:hypothetical protein